MKAITLHAMWAAMIAEGSKTVEVRSRRIAHRGDLLICAGAKRHDLVDENGNDPFDGISIITRHAMAVVDLYDVVPYNRKKHAESAGFNDFDGAYDNVEGYAWLLRNIRPIKPVPVKGQQNLFDVDIPIECLKERNFDLIKWYVDNGFLTKERLG